MAQPPPQPIHSPYEAEELAARWMRWAGFRDAIATPRGADRGIDVGSAAALAQVKYHLRPIGRPALQQLHGVAALEKKRSFFFSHAGYTPQAREFADAVGIALFQFTSEGTVRAINRPAEAVARAADGLGPPVAAATKSLNGFIGGAAATGVAVAAFIIAWPEPRPHNPADCQPLVGVQRDCPGLFEGFGQLLVVAIVALGIAVLIRHYVPIWLNERAQRRLDRRHRATQEPAPPPRRT